MANRYYLDETRYPRTGNCVFISYHYSDREVAKQIANYISQSGVDIFFDEYNTHIGGSDPKKSVEYIKVGIRRSSHMLCVISQTALKSHLMPWEIGYGYDLVQVVGLTIKELSKSELPEYLQVVPVLRGTKSLNTYIANAIGKVEGSLIKEQRIFSASSLNHPLDNILDWQL